MSIHPQLADATFETPEDHIQTPPISVLSFSELCSPEGFGLTLSWLFMRMIHGFGCLVWHGLGSLVPGVLVLLEPDLELMPTTSDVPCSWCHLNSLSFLSPPRLSPASTSGIFVVSVFPCPSVVLWDPCAACRVGGFLSLAAPCAPSWESQLPKLQSSIPIASDPSLAQERDAVHWELWSAARLKHQDIHGMSGILFNNKNTTAFSELSG